MSQPNIILIIADQWRGDCLSVTGHTGVDTPNLDSLARQGSVFNHAYSSCPSCIAARASLFTGLAPNSHGRLGYKDQVPWNYDNMLAQMFSDAGYQTHCSGKTHFFRSVNIAAFIQPTLMRAVRISTEPTSTITGSGCAIKPAVNSTNGITE